MKLEKWKKLGDEIRQRLQLRLLTPNIKDMMKMINLMQRIPAFRLFGFAMFHVTRISRWIEKVFFATKAHPVENKTETFPCFTFRFKPHNTRKIKVAGENSNLFRYQQMFTAHCRFKREQICDFQTVNCYLIFSRDYYISECDNKMLDFI